MRNSCTRLTKMGWTDDSSPRSPSIFTLFNHFSISKNAFMLVFKMWLILNETAGETFHFDTGLGEINCLTASFTSNFSSFNSILWCLPFGCGSDNHQHTSWDGFLNVSRQHFPSFGRATLKWEIMRTQHRLYHFEKESVLPILHDSGMSVYCFFLVGDEFLLSMVKSGSREADENTGLVLHLLAAQWIQNRNNRFAHCTCKGITSAFLSLLWNAEWQRS